jgi:glycine/D-amino acid oxidase-like deaminating enzyme
MRQVADVIVIGAGSTGSAIAFHLTERGVRRVVVIEKTTVAGGPTGRSAAVVRQHYGNAILARLARECLKFFEAWRDRVGGSCGFRPVGFLGVVGPHDRAALEANVELQRSVGVEVALLAADDIRRLEPDIHVEDLAAGAFEPEAGYCDPVATTQALLAAARRRGAEVQERTEVLDILLEAGRVAGVRTSSGTISAPVVVDAAGPWAPAIASMVKCRLPIAVSRHSLGRLTASPGCGRARPVYADFERKFYLRSEGDHTFLVGSLDPSDIRDAADPDRFSADVAPDVIARFRDRVAPRFPLRAAGTWTPGWTSLYDTTPDDHPLLGAVEDVPGFIVAAGFSGHGFKLCPAVGDMIAGLIVDGRSDGVIDDFGVHRFQTGRLIESRYRYH